MNKYIETSQAGQVLEKNHEWDKWANEIPFISFSADWEVKIIPPFLGAIVRFCVRQKGNHDGGCSVYLDCYDRLGFFGEPYWELYPHNGDVFRCPMNDTESLLNAIKETLTRTEKEE